jgi:Glycine rich protein
MKSLEQSCCVLTIGAALALLAGCGASPPPTAAPGAMALRGARTQTYRYTGAKQTFTVPTGVTQISIAASGAGSPSGQKYTGGNGGLIKATIPVTPGENLAIFVGGAGGLTESGSGGNGGFNGGAGGGDGIYSSGYGSGGNGGGGASDVRQGGNRLRNRVIVAGGGGGAGGEYCYSEYCYSYSGAGGDGGGDVGGAGHGGDLVEQCRCYYPNGAGGKGGTQSAGGKGGRGGDSLSDQAARGRHGHLGGGGSGGCCNGSSGTGGGGAGGGYYGGGGGGAGAFFSSGPAAGGGGAGGSSYVEPAATRVKNIQGGAAEGNGQIVISW